MSAMLEQDAILTTADLQRATGYKRASDIEDCLIKQGVHVFWGKDGPWTTEALINAAGGLGRAGNDGMYKGIL